MFDLHPRRGALITIRREVCGERGMQAIDKNNIPRVRLAVILGALATFGPFGTDMYLSGFPSIARFFGTGVASVQMSLSVYFIGLAAGQVIYGPLVDRFGRRIPLVIGLALFTLASLGIVFCQNVESFIALRLLQALGGCSGMIVGRAVVSDLFDLRGASNFLSMLAVVQGLGPILAPTAGSFLLSVTVWQGVFVFLTIFGIGCFSSAFFGLPETLPPEKRRRVGAVGIARDYMAVLSRRAFLVPALSGALVGSSLFAYIAGSPFVFMHLYGVSAREYGLIFAGNAAGTLLAAQVNRLLLRRHSPQAILAGGMVFNIAAVIALALLAGRAPMWAFMIPLWLAIASMPLIFANSIALAMASCRDLGGSASAVVGLLQFGLASVSSAVVSLFDNGTAHPMTVVMLGGVTLGALVHFGLGTHASARERETGATHRD